ncbi:MAG: zeta toxin family protein, partial [Lachnospiraceae bacterium]|nr:zeta toxin family protein [Lachnospiraceae bacterium]
MPKLIILRGNSGSGKTTVAKALQEKFGRNTMLISHDMVRMDIFAFYYDLPFEETLRRHATKPKRVDFGEEDMRRWWNEKDFINIIPEKIITKDLSILDTIDMIYNI